MTTKYQHFCLANTHLDFVVRVLVLTQSSAMIVLTKGINNVVDCVVV